MATIKFILNHARNSDKSLKSSPVAIMVEVYVSKHKRPSLSTCLDIIPKHWNAKTQSAKATLTDHTKLNLRLQEIKKDLAELWMNNRDADKFELKRLANEYLKGKDYNLPIEKKNVAQFVSYVNEIIIKCEGSHAEIQRSGFTIGDYKQTRNLLMEFSEHTGYRLTFESINLEFYRKFTSFLWDTKHHSDNTVGKHIKNVKAWMNSSMDDELHSEIGHKKKKFQKITAETDEVFCDETEIQKIYAVDCSDNATLAERRDAFVLDCWIGLRFGDLCTVNTDQIEQSLTGRVIRVHTEKTQTSVVIPIHPLVESILSQYNGRFPKIREEESVQFNSDLKEIARRAGLTKIVQSRRTVKGKATISYLPKWKMVSIHTARRSFATNCYLMGVPTITIMAITGHKTEKAFLKYIRVTKEQHAHIMLRHFNSIPFTIMRKAQ